MSDLVTKLENETGVAGLYIDGKKLLTLKDAQKREECLAIVLCGEGVDQMLGVARLDSGTAALGAKAVYDTLIRWRLINVPRWIAFDTTNVMSGKHNGMCVEIERQVGRAMLRLPCRHHIAEILLKEACVKVLGSSSNSPEVPVLKDFKAMWAKLGKFLENYKVFTGGNSLKIFSNHKGGFPL